MQAAFDALKDKPLKAPVLAKPCMEGRFILDTDASNVGIGAVLSQLEDGEEYVICYGSKTLSKGEAILCDKVRIASTSAICEAV